MLYFKVKGDKMKNYKNYTRFISDCKEYIKQNNIYCRYFGWCGMAADIDILKIDGKYKNFSIITKKEIFDNSDGYYDKQGVKYDGFGRPIKG